MISRLIFYYEDSLKRVGRDLPGSLLSVERVNFKFAWDQKIFRLSLIPITETQEEYVLLKLARLLDGLPRWSIQRCPGCEKYFLNASWRKKRFCSPRCMWPVRAEERRKADPEKYRADFREYMRKRYRAKKGLPPLKDKTDKKGQGKTFG